MRMTYERVMLTELPWWQGMANRDPVRMEVSVYPIPFNKIANWTLRFVRWVQFGMSPDAAACAFEGGKSVGLREGSGRDRREIALDAFRAGYMAGSRSAFASIMEARKLDDAGSRNWFAQRLDADEAAYLERLNV